ncbi:aspartyl beta-hydroxylase [Azospirillum cavernae]|uniref:Aspartyl beta-hydroxylase n=1 Tax=Azospirillum cavernae TaxID=2320860 RepID=A0A418VXW5_9PROT|nr:aspartyl/asparaginyl beta-hydroxylase domain-containing protein [Azospirillum cavernae]RJF81965.1 aspartyl beta-hydroxylase [Azospirillum cavernae]
MDIGVPYRDLGAIDVSGLTALVAGLDDAAWNRNTFRQEALAAKNHEASRAIVYWHEWDIQANSLGFPYMEQLVARWARAKGLPLAPFLPVEAIVTDMGRVYAFPDWVGVRDVMTPVIEQVVERLGCGRAVVTRLALVSLAPKVKITPHIDGQPMATKAHRIHIALTDSPKVTYRIGSRDFTMKRGHAYDFNNRRKHAVENRGDNDRINLFLDVYPNPAFSMRADVLSV